MNPPAEIRPYFLWYLFLPITYLLTTDMIWKEIPKSRGQLNPWVSPPSQRSTTWMVEPVSLTSFTYLAEMQSPLVTPVADGWSTHLIKSHYSPVAFKVTSVFFSLHPWSLTARPWKPHLCVILYDTKANNPLLRAKQAPIATNVASTLILFSIGPFVTARKHSLKLTVRSPLFK